ncbi:MAG TPA: CBS domain-containing protein [Vicinamibacteria bacterium]|jgi:acetoin utilization protein AcuB
MTNVKVRDLMTAKVTTLGRNDRVDLADEMLAMGRIRHLPIVEEGAVVGIVSQRDLFRSGLAAATGIGTNTRKKLLQGLLVKEIMNEPVITVDPDATVQAAARLMVENKIGCLPVVSEGRLQGLLTETDVLRYVADGRVLARGPAAELPAVTH